MNNNIDNQEGGGDNFVKDDFRPPRGLEYVKLQIPTFAGGSSTDDYLDWESKVGRLFKCYEIEGYTRVRLVAIEFTGMLLYGGRASMTDEEGIERPRFTHGSR